MPSIRRVLATLADSAIGIAVMVVLATIVFYVTVFVVTTGARLAGHRPSSDFVVLAAALIVVAVILTGGLTPRMTRRVPVELPARRSRTPRTTDRRGWELNASTTYLGRR